MMKNEYENTNSFENEYKHIKKKYRSLDEDMEIFKRYVIETYFLQNISTDKFVRIDGSCNEIYDSFKVRKYACKALKNKGNRTGIRIIFVRNKETGKITFLEIYLKSDKESEDKERITKYINKEI